MKKLICVICLCMIALLTVQKFNGLSADEKGKHVLRHVVLFTFKADAKPEQVQKIVDAFGELPSKIDTIQDYEWGVNNSPEKHDKGHTHCFLVTFKSEADRDAYLPHEAHQAFVKELLPILEDVTVVDYWASK